MRTPRLFVVVGSPGSGKDILIRAVYDMGVQHAQVIPKHTDRRRNSDDGKEMICPGDEGYDLLGCDVVYPSFRSEYGLKTSVVWDGLKRGISQVAVISNVQAINRLRALFGPLTVLLYVHSEMSPEEYLKAESKVSTSDGYVQARYEKYAMAFRNYLSNFLAFDHVLIYAGQAEDFYDQLFRLFRYYERCTY